MREGVPAPGQVVLLFISEKVVAMESRTIGADGQT